MRLLLITQVVDSTDTSLGFFHSWIEKLSKYFETIEVICLYEGVHSLPSNVQVYSLGKEKGSTSRLEYSLRFLKLVWQLRKTYDRVFVHMNQEYVLLGGIVWKLLGKKIYMWRNHYAGSVLTRIAGNLCERVFCTSAHSFTAQFKNAQLMPVGVETDLFEPKDYVRNPNSILFLGRMTPSKKPDVLIEALMILNTQGVTFTATFCGPVRQEDNVYVNRLKEKARTLRNSVIFLEGVPHNQTNEIYGEHEIYVNLGASGMFDKTLFEAAASGCLVVALSEDFNRLLEVEVPSSNSPEVLSKRIKDMLLLTSEEKSQMRNDLLTVSRRESLDLLCKKISSELQSK